MKAMRKRPLTIALTGGLAAGKSEAMRTFARCGAWTLSLDALARRLSRKGASVWRAVVRTFGRAALRPGGGLDREALAREVFRHPRRRRLLERAAHPAILREMRRRLSRCRSRVAVVDVPLLFERGLQREFDASVLVCAPSGARLARALRRGMPRSDALARMRAQWPQRRKEAIADVVLRNDASLHDFRRAVRERFHAFRLIATSPQGDR